jgi:hypothetical protein
MGPELRALNPAPSHTYPGITMPAAVNTAADPYDSNAVWRDRAMAGTLHSGTVSADPRSRDRTCF